MSQLESLQQTAQSKQSEIKAFLQRQQWKEALIFFFFLLLSFGFWILQSLQEEYETELQIPIIYKNIAPEIAFNGSPQETIFVKIKDKGSVLLNYQFGRAITPLEINMKGETGEGQQVFSRKEVESVIKKRMIATTTILNIDPQEIFVSYSKRASKELPVRFNGQVSTEIGFKQSDVIQISPNRIKVFASQQLLDTLNYLQTTFFTVEKGKKTINRNIALEKIAGVNYEQESVIITIPIEEFTEKTLEIPISCTDQPEDYTLRTFPTTVKITCNVPLSRFKGITEQDFTVEVSAKEIERNQSGTLSLQLTKKPAGVDAIQIIPNRVEFILEQKIHHD